MPAGVTPTLGAEPLTVTGNDVAEAYLQAYPFFVAFALASVAFCLIVCVTQMISIARHSPDGEPRPSGGDRGSG
ncbi:hypothetical protein GCM10025777_38550 [Membranihabitans marinus]|uniref:Uncharacterized protein n=1 Tax=Nesterenkonia rhizosphaerae TaxID=1348272 RepID=A0ABP9G0W8_9MICC